MEAEYFRAIPFVKLKVRVGKEEIAALAMAIRREVLPLVGRRVYVAEDNQTPVVDTAFVFVRENKDLCGRDQLREFGFIFRGGAGVVLIVAIAVEPPIHGIAARPEESGMVGYNRNVGGTSIDRGARNVSVKNTSLDVRRVRVKLCVAQHPGARIAFLSNRDTWCHAWRHHIVVLVYVIVPSDGQLAKVAGAGNGLGLRFGFGQRWQKHRRENRDNGNDDQKFD